MIVQVHGVKCGSCGFERNRGAITVEVDCYGVSKGRYPLPAALPETFIRNAGQHFLCGQCDVQGHLFFVMDAA